MKIDILDHGYVRLVSYMQPAPDYDLLDNPEYGGSGADLLIDAHKNWSGDLEIVRNARTSYNADWRGRDFENQSEEKDAKLIHYLWEHRHTTPFEAMVFTFEVQAPIFVFRQWHRHRTWSYNEVSARYTELPDLFYVPKPEHVGAQSKKNKQGRGESLDPITTEEFIDAVTTQSKEAYREYKLALGAGVSRELARLMLPVNTYSRMFATVDLHNLFHFLELRLDEHAQYEIRVYAEALLKLIEPIVPVAVAAFKKEVIPLGTKGYLL